MDATIRTQDISQLTQYLTQHSWLKHYQRIIALEKPREGNRNLVLRVVPDKGSTFMVKQARPWVEKYPYLAAPVEHLHVEYQYFYHTNKSLEQVEYLPEILGFDPVNNVLVMQVFGSVKDFTQPGLQLLGSECKQEHGLLLIISQLGSKYLRTGNFLLHGDFYPGSMLNADHEFKVIDTGFSFEEPEEWDLPVLLITTDRC